MKCTVPPKGWLGYPTMLSWRMSRQLDGEDGSVSSLEGGRPTREACDPYSLAGGSVLLPPSHLEGPSPSW